MQGSLQRIVDMYTGDDTCLVIPVYQRNYDWKQENCARLFDDLVEVAREGRENHFFGSIVYKDEGAVGESTIIDGQQRLTTINLLFLALYRALKDELIEPDDKLAVRIEDGYLLSEYAASGHKLKLKPVKADAAAYEKLFGDSAYFDETSKVTANFRYFLDRIQRAEITAQQLFEAIRKLQVMRLKLEASDNAQMIFESLNSTGLDLSQADMIRNFVLMDVDRSTQERLYEDYWNRIEINVDYDTSTFIRHYLTAKLNRSPRINELYDEFRAYVRREKLPVPTVLAELRTYSDYERQLRTAGTHISALNRLLSRFNLVDRDVAMPLLLSLMDGNAHGDLPDPDLLRAIQAVDTYLARRWISGYQSNAHNKIFAMLYREALRARRGTDYPLADVIIYLLTRRQGTGGFPTDQEFSEALLSKDFYHVSAAQRNYFWESLENGASNDVRDIAEALSRGDISIEHIMPQTLTPEWQTELGPNADRVHDTWLHRLGNLTVTGYNSSYSNAPFAAKRDRDKGFRESPYRINHVLRDTPTWNETEIQHRADTLREQALQLWPTPATSFEPAPDVGDVEPMGDDTTFKGRTIRFWQYQGTQHAVASWKQMMLEVLALVNEQAPSELRKLATTHSYLTLTAPGATPADGFFTFAPGVAAYTSTNTDTKIWVLREVFAKAGLDLNDLVFQMAPLNTDTTTDTAQDSDD